MPSEDDAPVFEPLSWLEREEALLAPYAMRTQLSKGRLHPEPVHPYRSLYQRDRDRIVHSTAFRRLMYKTQVLVNQTSDHHRTRLTHTLEVAQIGRTIARQLGLNEDLTEAIALLHDLGHPPFGHAGETALNECLEGEGGFNHNHHGLRIVTQLEYCYPDFPGLNLSYEVLEAQAMHGSPGGVPNFLPTPGKPLLEAQVVDAADSLAYDTHDLDDALGVGLITLVDLEKVPFWTRILEKTRYKNPGPLQLRPTAVRALIDWQVADLLEQSRRNLHGIRGLAEVRASAQNLVAPGDEVRGLKANLETFLRERVYGHYRVKRMAHKGQRILQDLFEEFSLHPDQLPDRYQARIGPTSLPRVVCDYLAGMTDRFAQDEYLRLFQPYTPL